MSKGHFTQWAAQFAVASEMCKREYQVALTLGNHPAVDLMVISPSGQTFSVDVKGLSSRNGWIVRRREPHVGLFYVLSFVARDKPNRFFVMTQQQVNDEIDALLTRLDRPTNFPVTGFLFKRAEAYENKWDILPT
jgi:hypothetical protein